MDEIHTKQIRCGMYITPKKRPKFGYDKFIEIAQMHGVIIVDLDLEGEVSNLPTNLDAILHKACTAISYNVSVAHIAAKIVTFDFAHASQITDDYAKSSSSEIAGRRFDAFKTCIKMNPKVCINLFTLVRFIKR